MSIVPLAQRIARWTSNPKVLGSIPRWDDCVFCFSSSPGSMFLISFLSVAVITCALHAQGRRFEPGRKHIFSFCSVSTTMSWSVNRASSPTLGFHGVMVSTLDFESSDPSSNLGGTLELWTPWRNGSASDSRSEGCVFESRRGQKCFCLHLSEDGKQFASNED